MRLGPGINLSGRANQIKSKNKNKNLSGHAICISKGMFGFGND